MNAAMKAIRRMKITCWGEKVKHDRECSQRQRVNHIKEDVQSENERK